MTKASDETTSAMTLFSVTASRSIHRFACSGLPVILIPEPGVSLIKSAHYPPCIGLP